MARILSEMCAEFGLEPERDIDTEQVEITGVVSDASRTAAGDILVADAERLSSSAIELAIERGAAALLTDSAGASLITDETFPVLVVDQPRLALGHISQWLYRTDPATPRLLAVMGSRGKTSVVYLLDQLLRSLGIETGTSTNRERRVADERSDSHGVTPEADELHAMLARMREVGVHVASIELGFADVVEHRVNGLYFDVAGFLNLDARLSPNETEREFEGIAELFSPEHSRRGVVNIDTEWGRRLVEETRIPITTLSAEGREGADWTLQLHSQTALGADALEPGTDFGLIGPDDRELRARTTEPDKFAAINAATAIIMLDAAGWDVEQLQVAIDRQHGIHPQPESDTGEQRDERSERSERTGW